MSGHVNVFVLGTVSYEQLPKHETRLARLSRTCSLVLSHPVVCFLPHSPFGQLFIKNKKETAARRETKAAEGRRVTGVSEAGNQAGGIDVIRRSLNFCPQFLRRKHENLHNFCVEVA